MCSSNSQIIICFECKQQIKKKQLFSLHNYRYSGSQPFMIHGPFSETLNTCHSLLRILSKKTNGD